MNKKRIKTRTMVQAGFLVAMSIVLTRMLSFMASNTLRLGLGDLPIMLSGFLFGPIVGGVTGIAADLIGVAMNPMGPPHIGFTISSMLWGVIPGVYIMLFKGNRGKDPYSNLNIIIPVMISILVISVGLNTLWLSRLYGKGFFIMLPARIVNALINIPLQSLILINLIKYLKNMVGVDNG